jgi:hypothetical protein
MRFFKSTPALVTACLFLLCLLTLAACGGGIGGSGATPQGTMRVSVTDAPACGYDEVNVTITKVRVHQSTSAVDSDAGWSEITLATPRRLDLLTLTNGALVELGQTLLPAGKYTQLRLVLAENTSAAPFANSVIPTGGAETALTTPSGSQTGIKINLDADVPADKIADVVLDFDACKSVVKRGASGQYNLKPVISATTALSDAGLRVVGYVAPSIAVGSTSVSLQSAGVTVKATVPDADGRFVLYPVPVGTYDLVITSAGHVTTVLTGVPVTTTSFTTLNAAALPINPPAATTLPVLGTVTPATATVRALTTLTGGPTIETAWAPVDGTTGAFGFALPIEAPVKASYAAGVTPVFTADTAAASKYTLEANSAGSLLTQVIDVTAAVPVISFLFP